MSLAFRALTFSRFKELTLKSSFFIFLEEQQKRTPDSISEVPMSSVSSLKFIEGSIFTVFQGWVHLLLRALVIKCVSPQQFILHVFILISILIFSFYLSYF